MSRPAVVTTVAELRAHLKPWRQAGERIALVPTMGALHAGHISLVRIGHARAERVVTSIFVNPKQFAPTEDLATYPRDFDGDLAKLAEAGVDLVFAPEAGEMYPDGEATVVTVGGPSAGLESDARPHFFAGVATVVTKLLIQCAPDVAIFGEKDFQQLAVIRTLTRDLALPTEIVAGATMREPDGLAMSSRNLYLGKEDRRRATALSAALAAAGEAIEDGAPVDAALVSARRAIEAAGFTIDYVELRDAETLAASTRPGKPRRLLAAARIGGVRLIDNIAVVAVE
ncbi:pantoate--beta-alanine ligase [Methylopila sp. 73B]|uniref:pantoate--beta-alanine ligase n=1 Tax=Methylopila sp. 73B TaxID=1120792 RepID=UPI0003828BBE|nr:pantoate--beta-alanine ligase [Methylopila sp. 73B]